MPVNNTVTENTIRVTLTPDALTAMEELKKTITKTFPVDNQDAWFTLYTGYPVDSTVEKGTDADGNPIYTFEVKLRDDHFAACIQSAITGMNALKRAEEGLRKAENALETLGVYLDSSWTFAMKAIKELEEGTDSSVSSTLD